MAEDRLSIYRASRSIKKKDNSLYNALRSIYEDSIFIGEISQLWPQLPLLANLRCGLWYSPNFDSTCYFKSTDGHCNNWSFNTSRLNLHVAQLAGQKGGCIIVDSTRKGKRFPDSMSKTIPIWTCVLNRAIAKYSRKMHCIDLGMDTSDCNASNSENKNANNVFLDWDCSLHLPVWVSKSEKASIEDRLEDWTTELEASGADIGSVVSSLKKPLRPLWISQKTVIWLNEVPDSDSWDFTPIILVSGSSSSGIVQQMTSSSEFSWHYIPGAGDDEESWARGLSPSLFWMHSYDIINSGPNLCNQKVADIVEKDRVYRAQRGKSAPQITIKSQNLLARDCEMSVKDADKKDLSSEDYLFGSENSNNLITRTMGVSCSLSWVGSTKLAVGTTQIAEDMCNEFGCILNCDLKLLSGYVLGADAYLHLPILTSKFDRSSLLSNLHSALKFAKLNLSKGKTVLVCCGTGEDISVCVCLAILTCLFNDQGSFDGGKYFEESCVSKLEMRKRLIFMCRFVTNARPSRGNLKQVFCFLNRKEIN